MKYILRYELKSKYFGFKKVYYKEFDDPLDIFQFVVNNKIIGWKVYQRKDYYLNDLLGEEDVIC